MKQVKVVAYPKGIFADEKHEVKKVLPDAVDPISIVGRAVAEAVGMAGVNPYAPGFSLVVEFTKRESIDVGQAEVTEAPGR